MFESMVAFVMPEHMGGLAFDPPRGASGYSRLVNPERRPYATADGFLCVLPYTTPQWHRFFALIGRDDLIADASFADPVARQGRMQALYGLIADVMPSRTTATWVADLRAADILFGEVLSPEQLLADPHLVATDTFTLHDHPTEGRIRLIGARDVVRRLPPRLGEHSRAVLLEAGLSPAAVDALVSADAIVDASE